mmetsp:Transcript_35075/g.56161  ORF Transcript_35075/g.56161 Transcript_35075/m.56161 type:complete len:231 (-) Transcript_35075:212-904(-)
MRRKTSQLTQQASSRGRASSGLLVSLGHCLANLGLAIGDHVSNAGLEGGFDHRVRQWKPPGQQQFHVAARGMQQVQVVSPLFPGQAVHPIQRKTVLRKLLINEFLQVAIPRAHLDLHHLHIHRTRFRQLQLAFQSGLILPSAHASRLHVSIPKSFSALDLFSPFCPGSQDVHCVFPHQIIHDLHLSVLQLHFFHFFGLDLHLPPVPGFSGRAGTARTVGTYSLCGRKTAC